LVVESVHPSKVETFLTFSHPPIRQSNPLSANPPIRQKKLVGHSLIHRSANPLGQSANPSVSEYLALDLLLWRQAQTF
jgi:hypothetical protein